MLYVVAFVLLHYKTHIGNYKVSKPTNHL